MKDFFKYHLYDKDSASCIHLATVLIFDFYSFIVHGK